MAKNLYFEFGPDIVERVQKLTEFYGEPSPEATVARALGLLETVTRYAHDGVLTVVDPDVSETADREDRDVYLTFDSPAGQTPTRHAA